MAFFYCILTLNELLLLLFFVLKSECFSQLVVVFSKFIITFAADKKAYL